MPDSPDSGWYDDPYGEPGLLRWWDGRQWTDATEPTQAASPEPPYGHGSGPVFTQPLSPDPAHETPWAEPYVHARAGGRGALPWLLAAGAGLVVIVVAVVVTVYAVRGAGGGGPAAPSGSPALATSSTPATPAVPTARSAVIGTVTDTKSGISYDRLGPPWTAAGGEWFQSSLFTAGQVSVVQAPFEHYASFNATNLSGVPRADESAG